MWSTGRFFRELSILVCVLLSFLVLRADVGFDVQNP